MKNEHKLNLAYHLAVPVNAPKEHDETIACGNCGKAVHIAESNFIIINRKEYDVCTECYFDLCHLY